MPEVRQIELVRPLHSRCFFADFSERSCDGPMDRAHLIAKQRVKKHLLGSDPRLIRLAVWHPSVWVWGCRRHHSDFDVARTIRLTRADLPVAVELYAKTLGLEWSLHRDYGPRIAA